MHTTQSPPDLYERNLATTLLRTAIEEFHAMPFHLKLSSHIDDALAWCERFYESAVGTSYTWETPPDRATRQRLRYNR